MLYTILTVLPLICCAPQETQNKNNESNALPGVNATQQPSWEVTFAKKYPNVKVDKWSQDDHGYYEAEFEYKGETHRADFDKNGQWIETENDIKYKELPEVVRNILEKEYGNEKEVTEVEHVMSAEKGEFFDVEYKRKGKNHDVEIREDGTIIKG